MNEKKEQHGGARPGSGRPLDVPGAPKESQVFVRVPRALKARITRAHNRRGMKESPWVLEALEEKLAKEKE